MVKPEKAEQVEIMILQMAQRGQVREKVRRRQTYRAARGNERRTY